MLELGRGHELAQPRDVEVGLGVRRRSPQQRAEELEQRAPPHRDAVGLQHKQLLTQTRPALTQTRPIQTPHLSTRTTPNCQL